MNKRLDTLSSFLVLKPIFKAVLSAFFALEVKGADTLKQYPTAIFAGNHTGFLDGPIVLAAIDRPVLFIMADCVLSWPVIGWLVRGVGILTLQPSRAKSALSQAVQHVKQQQSLCIFPEGQLTPDGELLPFHGGVAFLQAKTQVPIIPFAIQGGYEAWHWGQKLPRLCKISIQFGEPIFSTGQSKEVVLAQLRDQIQTMKNNLEAPKLVQPVAVLG